MNAGSLAALIWFAFAHLNVNAFQGRVSLSPKTWFPRDFRRLQALQSVPRRPKPLAFSDGKGLVAGTSNAFAVHAGTEALSKGGNAMDACLTTALTEITLATGSRVSYAGAVNILYYDSISGETYNLDAGWNKPYYIDSAQIPDDQSQVNNGASILVPGFIAGVSMAVDKFSLFPLSKLLGPALHFAQEGFKVPADLADAIRKYYNPKTLLRTREGKNIFTNPKTQKPYRAGERLRQPKLAKFLKRLSKHGKDYFYRGHWAEEMVETAQTHEGYITMEDMNEYRVASLPPASTRYQHYQVLTSGTEWGGLELVEMLNLMELAGIGNSTDSYLTNARKFFWLASITRLSSFISLFTEGVPNGRDLLKEHLDLDIANSNRLTKNVAEQLWDRIASPSRMRELNDMMQEMLATNVGELNMNRHERGSSGVVAMDSEGNVCSLVHGTESQWWGSGLFVQGVSLPSAGIALKSLMKQTKAGGRLPSGLRPVIVFKEDFADMATSRRNKREIPVLRKGNTDKLFQNKTPGKKANKTMHKRIKNSEEPFRPSLSNESQPTNQSLRFHYHSMAQKDGGIIEGGERNNNPIGDRNSSPKKKGETVRHTNVGKSLTVSKLSSSSKKSTQAFQKTDGTVSLPLIALRGHPLKENDLPLIEHGPHDFHILGEDELDKDSGHGKVVEQEQDQLLWEDVEHIDLEDIREFPHLGIPESWEPEVDLSEPTDEEKFPVGLIPVLALACTGRSHPFVVPQYLTNILDSGMNPKAALEAPTFLAPFPHSYQQDIQVEKYAIDENILMGVDELGQSLREVDFKTAEDEAGIGVAITFDSRRKMLGCAHPYKEGFAEGVSELRVFK